MLQHTAGKLKPYCFRQSDITQNGKKSSTRNTLGVGPDNESHKFFVVHLSWRYIMLHLGHLPMFRQTSQWKTLYFQSFLVFVDFIGLHVNLTLMFRNLKPSPGHRSSVFLCSFCSEILQGRLLIFQTPAGVLSFSLWSALLHQRADVWRLFLWCWLTNANCEPHFIFKVDSLNTKPRSRESCSYLRWGLSAFGIWADLAGK